MKRITDPDFKYTSSVDTDIRKTFKRYREEQSQQTQSVLTEASSKSPNVDILDIRTIPQPERN